MTIEDAAKQLKTTVCPHYSNNIWVGVGKDKIYVYTTKKWCSVIPQIWQGFPIVHHKNVSRPVAN